MIKWIVAAEIMFWIAIFSGLFVRYVAKQKKLSIWILLLTPLIDIALIVLTSIDLRNGANASFAHGIAAVYLGISIAYGKVMLQWADEKFQKIFLKKDLKNTPLFGLEKGIYEMKMWARHLLAFIIGGILLLSMVLYIGDGSLDIEKSSELMRVLSIWTFVLIIDFLISFSYIVFPKRKTT